MFILHAPPLQAGGDGGQLVSVVPAGLTRLFQHPTLDWNLFSTRQQPLTDREVRCLLQQSTVLRLTSTLHPNS